jgi:hypothetical protein
VRAIYGLSFSRTKPKDESHNRSNFIAGLQILGLAWLSEALFMVAFNLQMILTALDLNLSD